MIFFNQYFDKNRLKVLVLWNLTRSGEKTTIDLVEKLKDLGFHYATQAGLSLSIDDLKIPPTKAELILETETIVQSSQRQYEIGNLTAIERFQKMIDVWHRTSEVLKQNVVQHFRATDILNPVYMMAFSGARGNISQVRQLTGMRGLMADPQGQILDFPIRSNFREGLTLTEYVISCYGARKGLVDTALRTANSGYLTRRLVDVAQHIIVRQLDCGTTNGILVSDMKNGKKIILPLQKRIIGRVLAENINSIAFKNQDISPSLASKLVKLKNQIRVRSPLTCEAKNSVCQLCYGWSLAHGNLVSLGEAVGILAAQSIGEPGTQLTMRTFHTGGVFSGDVMQEIRSPFNGIVQFLSPLQGSLIRTLHGKIAFLTKVEGDFFIIKEKKEPIEKRSYQIPISSILFVRQFQSVKEKQLVVEFSSFVNTNNKGIQAKYNLNSEKEGQIFFEKVLLVVKGDKEGNILKTALNFGSIWILAGKLYESPIRSTLFIKPGDLIDTNSILNESILATPFTGFLESFKEKKQKPILISNKIKLKNKALSKNELKNEVKFITQLLTGNKDLIKGIKQYPLKKVKNNKVELTLKQPFNNIFFKDIEFKKFGYFFSIEHFIDLTFFSANPLFQNSSEIKEFSLLIFQKNILNQAGIFYFCKNKRKDQNGQYFILKQINYQLLNKINKNSFKNFGSDKKLISKKIYLENKNNLINLVNLQGNKQKISSTKKQFLTLNGFLVIQEKGNKQKPIFYKKVFLFKENPYRNKVLGFNNKIKLKGIKNSEKINSYKNCSLPASILKQKDQIRKSSTIDLILYFYKNYFLSENQKLKKLFSYKETDFFLEKFKLQLDLGWIVIPENKKNFIFSHSLFFNPGNWTNISDQLYSLFKIIKGNELLKFLTKPNSLKKTRYINNKLFKFRRVQKKVLPFEKQSTFKSLLNKAKISRNQIILKNYFRKTKFFLLIKKGNELNYKNKLKKNLVMQKLCNNFNSLYFYKNNSLLFNKQKITRVKKPISTMDIIINETWINNKRNWNKPTISITLNIPKKTISKQAKIELLFPKTFQVSIIQKIHTCNSFFPENLNKEKLLLTKQKVFFEQNNLIFNSFASSSRGEITSRQIDAFGKQKSLLLTTKDQTSFLHNQQDSLIKIGQLLRYGDPISSHFAVEQSGQIIEIDKNKITLRKAQPILFSSQGVFHVDNGDLVEKNTPLITLFYQKLKTEDIVQGIPKIEELFEARQTKEGEALHENLHTRLHFFFNFYKQQFSSQEAVRKSIEKIQQFLVNNVQKVYQSQGVTIADKHIEIIVRQMTTKVKITESGRTGLLRGELIDLEWVEVINLGIQAQNEIIQQELEVEKAEYEPIILGITKAALETESFISASSFQETTRILSRAAIERKTDFLRGLKENVILGHLIPAGTGFRLSFDPQLKILNTQRKLSWLSYKDVVKMFTK